MWKLSSTLRNVGGDEVTHANHVGLHIIDESGVTRWMERSSDQLVYKEAK